MSNELKPELPSGSSYPNKVLILSIPASSQIIFPTMMFPLEIHDEIIEKMVNESLQSYSGYIAIAVDLEKGEQEPKNNFFKVACLAKIVKKSQQESAILLNTLCRCIINDAREEGTLLLAEVSYPEEKIDPNDDELKSYITALVSKIKELVKLNPIFTEEIKFFMSRYGLQDPQALTDTISMMLSNSTPETLMDLLGTLDIKERIRKVLKLLQKEIEISTMKDKINKEIEKKMSKQQREFFLREQLSQIKKELGMEKDDKSEEVAKFEKKLSSLKLTDEAKKIAGEELEKLKLYDNRSPEYSVSRNYLQWICDVPWGIYTKDVLDIKKIEKTLNDEHYGMEDVKSRILEFVAIQKLKKTTLGTVLLLVGPPGVGKTTLARSIANALGRKVYNFSLGAMRDEAELKGHRRTYIGALPGKMVQALKTAASSNPVIVLDEIDKMNASYKGDPSSALLEVLDPEQNNSFLDHYLDLRVDLSRVLFIATANQLDSISPPILDRMEIIQLDGYTMEEKLEIAKKYVIPKVYKETGVSAKKLQFSDESIKEMIDKYARESGVRSLQQVIRKIMRKIAYELAVNPSHESILIKQTSLQKYLGQERFKIDRIYDEVAPGIVTGLAWTAVGGATLYIESKIYQTSENGGGDIKITGRLGETMKESAQIAYSYVQSIASNHGIDPDFFKKNKIHLHIPEGATPKDGPSAGITMALSLFSLASGKVVPPQIAMTGELTISGKVLPIGGVKEKIMAGRRVKKKTLIFPEENKKDVELLSKITRKHVALKYVGSFEDVIKLVFSS